MKLTDRLSSPGLFTGTLTLNDILHIVVDPTGTPVSYPVELTKLNDLITSGGIVPLPLADIIALANASTLNVKLRYITNDQTEEVLFTPVAINKFSKRF